MITEQDLQAAIAECEGVRNPNANTCLKLAAYYTIKDKMYPTDLQEPEKTVEPVFYSRSAPPERLTYESNTAFGQIVKNHDPAEIMAAVDELVETVKILNPRLYAGFIRKFDN